MPRNYASERIRRDLERHRRFLDFTDGDFGKNLAKIFTDGCFQCIANQSSPGGTRWNDLSPDYAAWKSRNYPGQGIGVLHFLMSDPAQVSGVVDVSSTYVICTYGVSAEAKEEASWFQEGDASHNRPERRFWGFTTDSTDATKAYLDARFHRLVA